jgi:ribosomal protein S18 acetylase RimI-like enzyme
MTAQPGSEQAVSHRPYRDAADWWRIRSLLIEAWPRNPHGSVWDIRRWDGWRFHRAELADADRLAGLIGLWETEAGRTVGAVHPEGNGDAYLEVDPDFRHLEPEMIHWAEAHLARETADGRTIEFWASDEDQGRREVLAAAGYRPADQAGWMRCLRFDRLPETEAPGPAEGYRFRSTESSDADCARMAGLLNAGFGRTVHSPAEIRNFVDFSPSFEHELNLVAVAPDGAFAATVGITYDAANRHGLIEPVCTDPDHRRLGLARGLLLEGLARLRARGALSASLDTGEGEAANALYVGCGFTEGHHFRTWRRTL